VTYFGGLLSLATLALWIYCTIDVVTTPGEAVRTLPKTAWLLLVVFLPPFGPLSWLGLGRPRPGGGDELPPRTGGGAGTGRVTGTGGRTGSTAVGRAPRPLAPDDDPEFLAGLRDPERRAEADHDRVLREWEADLRRREDELRRRDDDDGSGPVPS